MPELSRTQVVVYGALAIALLLVGVRAIRPRRAAGRLELELLLIRGGVLW